jgi:aspartyl-tRNA(Asn)/glutamyl-tRNA(Gln) amidotransferase subunit A
VCAWSIILDARRSSPERKSYHVRFENIRSSGVRSGRDRIWCECNARRDVVPSDGLQNVASDPADLVDARALLVQRRLSSLELTEACLAAIERRNGGPPSFNGSPQAINAWVRVYDDRARAAARAADERRDRAGEAVPALCGIPIAVKDLYGVAGLPLTASSAVLEGNVASEDAAVWARLETGGMVLLGHTHTHEFAAGGTTDQVGNPWALDRVAGGSSGGSAAALAARMTPAALGSDTCGSLRIPSACCGTSAIKPTHGRLPLRGVIPLAASLDHPGPMARTIADCSALLAAMAAGAPPVDPLAPPPVPLGPLPEAARAGSRPLQGLTIAVTDRPERADMEPAIAGALDDARTACERLGARVLSIDAPWYLDWDDLSVILLTEVWAQHRAHATSHHRYRPAIAEFVEAAQGFTDAGRYLAAQERRAAGAAAWETWFSEHRVDLVLEPTLPIEPYGRGSGYDRGHAGGPGDPMIALTALWDLTGMPVASLPVSWSAGVSLIAPRGGEAGLIAAAIDLQVHGLGVPHWAPPLSESQSPSHE